MSSTAIVGGINSTMMLIDSCFASVDIRGTDSLGGLVGVVYPACTLNITSSYSTGNIIGDRGIGGLVGYNVNELTISQSYCIGDVVGTNYMGGFLGYAGDTSNSVFENCYTKSSVISSNPDDTGSGFLGYMAGSSNVTIDNCSVL